MRVAGHTGEPGIPHHGRRGQGRVVQGDGQTLVHERVSEAGANACGGCIAACRGGGDSGAGLCRRPTFVYGRLASIMMDSVVHTGTSRATLAWAAFPKRSVVPSKRATGLLETVTCVTSIQTCGF